MTRHAKASSAFTNGRSASLAATADARSSAARGASRDVNGCGAPSARRTSHGHIAVLAMAISLLAVALGAGIAQAATKGQISFFGSTGTGNGQFGASTSSSNFGPAGIAVNQTGAGGVTAGDLYVVDTVSNRIERFNADGTFIAAFGSAGTGNGQFNAPQGVAVDPNSGDVYVTDRENRRVQKFTAQGTFLRMWGWGVLNGAAAFQVCTSAQTCQIGTGAAGASAAGGQMGTGTASPRVIVDPDNGNVYVSDPTNRRIQEFDSSGNFIRLWGWDVVTAGKVAAGDLGTNNFEICTSAAVGDCKGANTSAGTDNGRFGSNSPSLLAIDANGVLYASDAGSGAAANRVQRFDTDNATPATLLNFLSAGNGAIGQAAPATAALPLMTGATTGLAVDTATGNLLVARDPTASVVAGLNTPANPNAETWIQEIANPGAELSPQPAPNPAVVDNHAQGEAWIGAANQTSLGLFGDITTRGSTGRIYATRPAVSQVAILNQPGAPATATAPAITANTNGFAATFTSDVNPNGSLTVYRFQYRVCPGGVCGSGAFTSIPATETIVGSGVGNVTVSQTATTLVPNTTYEVQLIADGFGAPVITPLISFATPAIKPTVANRPAAPVTDTTALLQAELTPNNSTTTYYFQYLSDAAFKANGNSYSGPNVPTQTPAIPASLPAGMSPVVVFQEVTGLTPSTTYHFRVIANNGTGGDQVGADQSFVTKVTPGPGSPGAGRAYELVSPAYKIGGVGVGWWATPPLATPSAGFGALRGDRFAVLGQLGTTLVDSPFAFADDWALATRTPQGWTHRPGATRGGYGGQNFRFLRVAAAADDLSRSVWRSNGGLLRMFPEMETWGDVDAAFIRDWTDGRWEVLAPTDPAQGDSGGGGFAVSIDGRFLAATVNSRGILGPADPSLDQLGGKTTYLSDVHADLSDTFPGDSPRALVGVCDPGTEIPAVSAGLLAAQSCPAPVEYSPGQFRDGSLISLRGAAMAYDAQASQLANRISRDGSRLFFMSPDPNGAPASCSGAGSTTACPAQLFVRQHNTDGTVSTRWLSRPQVPGQAASLLGPALFEGATPDGDKVFFRTNSPLSASDPNGTGSAPVTTGTPSSSSWDLYMYDLPDGPDGDSSTADADPGNGVLIRISEGPDGPDINSLGDGDCNSGLSSGVALRWASEDGERAYFTCAAPLPGVDAPADGTITSPAGTPATTATTNLYFYDATQPPADRWRFVANLPRTSTLGACATRSAGNRGPLGLAGGRGPIAVQPDGACVRGTADGAFLTLFTDGRLTADDPDSQSGDIYGYDAGADELVRLSRVQGGVGGTYLCAPGNVSSPNCNADPGFGEEGYAYPKLGLAIEPEVQGDHVAFFQSASRLVPEDKDANYDVYQWRNGALSLISTGDSVRDGAFFLGNDRTGKNVYFTTLDTLTWQDVDAVLDVYVARTGGGIPQPLSPPPCAVLADACQGAPAAAPVPSGASSTVLAGAGNVIEKPRKGAKKRCAKGKTRKGRKCVAKKKAKRTTNQTRRTSR